MIIEHEDRDFERHRRPRQARVPAGPRRPAAVHQVSNMTLSIDALTYRDIAKTIDHSLLRPELDDAFVGPAASWPPPTTWRRCASGRPMSPGPGAILAGTDVEVGTTIGFPHGNHRPTSRSRSRARRSPTAPPSWTWCCHRRPQVRPRRRGRRRTSRRSSRSPTTAGAIVKVIFENAYLTDDEKIRACHLTEAAGGDFVKTSTGFAPSGATHRRPAADARQHLAARPGQGRGRRPHARCAAGGDGRGRDPHRRHRDGDDPRRLPGPQGRRGAVRGRPARRAAAATDGRVDRSGIGMLGSGLHRRVPHQRPALRAGGPRRGELRAGRRASGGVRRAQRYRAAPYDSIEAVCARPGGRPGRRVAAQPRSTSRRSGGGRATARVSPAPSRSAGTGAEAGEMLRRVDDGRRLARLSRERRCSAPRWSGCARWSRRARIGRPAHVPGARGPQRPARAPTSGTPRRPAAARCWTWRRTASRPRATCSARTCRCADVFAWGATLVHGDRTTGEDNAVMLMRFEDGRVATMDVVVVEQGRPGGPLRGLRRRAAGSSRTSRRPRCGRSSSSPAGYLAREDRRGHGLGVPGRRTRRTPTATTR